MMQDLKKLIDAHSVISFDVFDTLIRRNVPTAKDIFSIVEMVYFKKTGRKIDFARMRVEAERKARKECEYREVNLDEIYMFVEKSLDAEQGKLLKQIELEVESDFCIKNSDIVDWYQYCLNSGKKVIIVSDMYLSSSQIGQILQKNGIKNYYRIYSSADIRKTKWEKGLLYDFVTKDLSLRPSEILHIGNDKRADYEMAKAQGLSAYWVTTFNSSELYCHSKFADDLNKISYSAMMQFIKNHISESDDRDYIIGFSVFGPLLYGYLKWIQKKAEKDQIDTLCFLSRDGYVLKRGFEALEDKRGIYFYASRRAFVVPYLQFCRSFSEMIACYKSWDKTFTLDILFTRLGLDINQYGDVLRKYGYTRDSVLNFKEVQNDRRVLKVWEEVYPDIVSNSKNQYILLKRYMEQEKIGNRVALVDVGAKCTIEIALRKLNEKYNSISEIKGYYLNLFVEETDNRQAFLSLLDANEKKAMFRFCYMFLEVFLSAPHGTVLGYQENENDIVPTLADYEYGGDQVNSRRLKELQQGALDFVTRFECELSKYFEILPELAIANFKSFGLYPCVTDAIRWGDFLFWADRMRPLAKPRNGIFYVWHPILFWHDFGQSLWPAGFLKRMLKFSIFDKVLFSLYKRKKG